MLKTSLSKADVRMSNKKHFKKTYAGKSTKRYLRLIKEINKAERFTSSEIEQLFLI